MDRNERIIDNIGIIKFGFYSLDTLEFKVAVEKGRELTSFDTAVECHQ